VTEVSWEKSALASDRDARFLYAAAFLLAFGGGHWWLALPFIINHLQGSDTQVGMGLAANMGMYALSVMIATPLIIRFNMKRILQVGTMGMTCSTILMCLIVFFTERGYDLPHPSWLLIASSALFGLSQAGFWPPLMGWLSTGCLSSQLNRRLSLFSVSWAVASFLCPYSAGLLVEYKHIAPILVAVVILILCCISISIPTKPRSISTELSSASLAPPETHPLLPCFRWMSRIALFAGFLSFGIARTQFPIYFKVELHNSESLYGMFLTISSIAMFVNYLSIGRTHAWHYRFSFFLIAQLFILLFQLTVLYCTHLYIYYFVAVLLGLGAAFCYSSHLYYGSAGGTRRYALMAIHECILASGFVIGALVGGTLSDHFHRLAPYQLGAGVLTVGILAQIILFLVYRSRMHRAKKDPVSKPNTG
jgi:MFS family permease